MRHLADVAVLEPGVAARAEGDQVRRAQAGDAQALEELVRTHWERVQRVLLRILGPRQDLEDLVQTTFLETLHALPGFRRESSLSTFVIGVAVHVARRAMRPPKVQRLAVSMEGAAELHARAAAPDESASAAEALRRVRALLQQISEPKRVAFLLWAFEGMPPAEIAAVMQASVPATRSRIYYAQKELLAAAQGDPYLREWLAERAR